MNTKTTILEVPVNDALAHVLYNTLLIYQKERHWDWLLFRLSSEYEQSPSPKLRITVEFGGAGDPQPGPKEDFDRQVADARAFVAGYLAKR